ncbi:hypothetical protein BpHYR1_039474 [Brachionus plicatilis]|uniref:Uncharacterized protein n=1 Tax=Brachionus plicatilis TaxID=10195 RepID=A0A3M7QTW2_BRAPC|nr:hypothetical protein BpHYR1_039474 [Brachionus plicatilis]
MDGEAEPVRSGPKPTRDDKKFSKLALGGSIVTPECIGEIKQNRHEHVREVLLILIMKMLEERLLMNSDGEQNVKVNWMKTRRAVVDFSEVGSYVTELSRNWNRL